jgi:hypothetical protein
MFVKDEHYKISSKKDDKVFYGLFDSIVQRGQNDFYYFYCVDLYDKNRNFISEIDHLYLTLDELKGYHVSLAYLFSEPINF